MNEQSTTQGPGVAQRRADIEFRIGEKDYRLVYEQAFVFAYTLHEQGNIEIAARLFERLESFEDRGPQAFIMQAFCEAAALHFDECSKPLVKIFECEQQSLAADLHNVFVSYHVGIRDDAIKAMVDLVNKHRELPILCLLLGDMFRTSGRFEMARKCWQLAIQRDVQNGAIAAVAARHFQGTMRSSL